jgi:tRNA (guanine37-N1)-methyltransferase
VSLRVDVITIFPEIVERYAGESILARSARRGVWELRTHDPREQTEDVHRSVDDAPFGGGAGMVMAAGPILRTVRSVPDLPRPLIALSPSGRRFNQALAAELAGTAGFSLLCGRYEGVDQRAIDLVCDDAVSLGDFVLAGGELAALCVIESVVRLVPGALGNDESPREESFAAGLLEYPQYTRPSVIEGRAVPEVLLSGDHERIARWRLAQSLRLTLDRRPDLIEGRGGLTEDEHRLLEEYPPVDRGDVG